MNKTNKIKEIKKCKESNFKNGDYYICLIVGNTKSEKIFLRGPLKFKPYIVFLSYFYKYLN